jgi:nucleoside-diphosphate-sugar epimerase
MQEGKGGVSEGDTLEGSRTGLKTGYGQSKWVSEKLLFEAGKRGLCGYVVRPGYIVGDAETAGAYLVESAGCITQIYPRSSHQHGRFYLAPHEGMHSTWTCSRYQ